MSAAIVPRFHSINSASRLISSAALACTRTPSTPAATHANTTHLDFILNGFFFIE
jgi:hypothetical protein